MHPNIAHLRAGIPTINAGLYRRIRFLVGDPVALIELPIGNGFESTLIMRDIEMERASRNARVDHVACPKDFTPSQGLSGDRETATAQSAAECLRRKGVGKVIVDRSLPMIFAEMVRQVGIEVQCDMDWGIADRRQKDELEIEHLKQAQRTTEEVMRLACQAIARARAAGDGSLWLNGRPLTSEMMQTKIDLWLLERGFSNPTSIVACGPIGADCHDHGSGPIRTAEPVIIDIFPKSKSTLYNGDCTRTVVHGKVSKQLLRMHEAVVEAKAAAIAAVRPGVTGEQVHAVTRSVIEAHGYSMGLPGPESPPHYTAMVHGTGHGLGLDVHEPPLLDKGGPELLAGDILTIEPGLYCKELGGIRIEDMVVVTADGCENFNRLPEGLSWEGTD